MEVDRTPSDEEMVFLRPIRAGSINTSVPQRRLWIIRATAKAGSAIRFLGRAPDGSVDPFMRTKMPGTPVWTSKQECEAAIKKAKSFLAIPATYTYEPEELVRA